MKNKIKIIAEAGCNHNGSFKRAVKLVLEAKKANADAIKFQMFDPNELVIKKAKIAEYANNKKKETQFQMLKKINLTLQEHFKLKRICSKTKIDYLCSGFDTKSLDSLRQLKLSTFKIPSGEINNYKYLMHIGKFKKKILLSTGMSTIKEIRNAINILLKQGTKKCNITLLQCNSQYPTPFSDINLKSILYLKKKFNLNVGISDHSIGIEVPIAAAGLGASVIEKHFTLNKSLIGPDHKSSLEPKQFSLMVKSIRNVEEALGKFFKKVNKSEKINIKNARKSIVTLQAIRKKETFTQFNIGVKRPGNGISADKYYKILGKKSKRNYLPDQLVKP